MMLKTNLPLLTLDNIILLPSSKIKLDISDSNIKKLIDIALNYFNGHLFFVSTDIDKLKENQIGVITKISMRLDLPNGDIKIGLDGIGRAKVLNYSLNNGTSSVTITKVDIPQVDPIESLADARTLKKMFNDYLENKKSLGNSILNSIENVNDINILTDMITDFM